MKDCKWTKTTPTIEGWYWVKWKKDELRPDQITMWYFDASNYDVNQLQARAELWYGPLAPPEENQ